MIFRSMKVPTHLSECTLLKEVDMNRNYIKANLICKDHKIDIFDILMINDIKYTKNGIYPSVLEYDQNFFFVVAVKFLDCQDPYVLLDKDLHGWNGWVYRDPKQLLKVKPDYKLWKCTNCGKTHHKGSIEVFSKGKEDFIAEKDGAFDVDLWYDAFSWFKMNIRCTNCGLQTDQFIDFETM